MDHTLRSRWAGNLVKNGEWAWGGFQYVPAPVQHCSLEQTSPTDGVHCVAPGVAPESQSLRQAFNYQIISILKGCSVPVTQTNYPSICLAGRRARLVPRPTSPLQVAKMQRTAAPLWLMARYCAQVHYVNIVSRPQTVPYLSLLGTSSSGVQSGSLWTHCAELPGTEASLVQPCPVSSD